MARTFNEVELMMKAAKKHSKVVTQMGNQGHSEANYFQFKAWTEAGIIKDVTAITAHMNSARRWHGWDTNIKNYLLPRPFLPLWIGIPGMVLRKCMTITMTISMVNGAAGMILAWVPWAIGVRI